MASRPIRPAPGPASTLSQVAPDPSLSGSQSRTFKARGRPPSVIQACESCREGKKKCDGGRPKCRSCALKSCPCVYFGEQGKTRAACTKKRLESCERLLNALRNSPPDEAAQLLYRIRSGNDLSDNWRSLLTNDIAHAPAEQTINWSLQEPNVPLSDEFSETLGSDLASNEQAGNKDGATPSSQSPVASTEGFPSNASPGRDAELSVEKAIGATRGTISGSPAGLSSHAGTTVTPKRILLPEATITHDAVNAFLACSNELLHVFTREQLISYHCSVFETPRLALDHIKPGVGCLMAAAAVGAQHLPDEFGEAVETAFYDIAKYFFEDVIQQQLLEAIKLCALLAQYNIFAKNSTAITYIEMGISLAREAGLDNHGGPSNLITRDERSDVRRTWRSLIYLSSWLSSTLGYVSESALASTQEVVSHPKCRTGGDIVDVIQDEMTKICLLKANTLRLHFSFDQITCSAINAIRDDLQSWYHQLPESLRLQTAGHVDGSQQTKRSVLHMHLLHLGAIMLLYRRIAAQRLRNSLTPSNIVLQPWHTESTLLIQSRDALIAAHNSARILKILSDDQLIFKRCWLVIFQAYTACTILLLVAAQKQAHSLGPLTQRSEKEHASRCISILEYCSTADPVATMFYRQLKTSYDALFLNTVDITDAGTSSGQKNRAHSTCGSCLNLAEHRPTQAELVDDQYLLCIPSGKDRKRAKHLLALFLMLSQPFGDPNSSESRETRNVNFTSRHLALREHRDGLKVSFWGSKMVPFIWDVNKWELTSHGRSPKDVLQSIGNICSINSGSSRTSADEFTSSMTPHGWAAACL